MKPDLTDIRNRLAFALDVKSSIEEIERYVGMVGGKVGYIKVNSVFVGNAPTVLHLIKESGSKVFLDLKFFDIPFTAENHVMESAGLGVSMLTLHALGGAEMIYKSVIRLDSEFKKDRPLVLAITILTSTNKYTLNTWMGISGTIRENVLILADGAKKALADGVVCSADEASAVRKKCGDDFLIVTPGIRFSGKAERDQVRVNTPYEAISNGSDILVMGSDLRKGDPEENVAKALEEIEAGLKKRSEPEKGR